ncbi:hypothetical protein RB195_004478 [Necator americanus]|uniref:Zinc metalloproteinase n=1 Tax=Necator americanus TaxID=51031 RepID=A0ABR1BLL6_NECAM
MRILLLILLLALTVNCGSDFFKGKLGNKIKALLEKIKSSMNVTSLLQIREKFAKLRDKIKKKLALTPQRKAEVDKIMKFIKLNKEDRIQKSGDTISQINKRTGMADILFQGDIVLTDDQANEITDEIENEGKNRTKRQAYRDQWYPQTIWPDGVEYSFDPSADQLMRTVFVKAAQAWMEDTCINFRENPSSPTRVRLFKQNGCWSMIGNTHREQMLSLGDGCATVAIATHEIGHAIGFWHTHARYDRDQYLYFIPQNVIPSWLDQFALQTPQTNENYGLPYDYGSIMHYAASSASQNGKPTMVPRDQTYLETLGSPFISFIEKLMINRHYGCDRNCGQGSAQCRMGGFPNPRDCSRCVCPSGYGGDLCDQRPPGCGGVVEASNDVQTLRDGVGVPNSGERVDMKVCNYWITAPEGSRIEVRISGMANGPYIHGCVFWGMEINTQRDQLQTGFRFCNPQDIGLTLVSSSNIVPIIVYNRVGVTPFAVDYRIGEFSPI